MHLGVLLCAGSTLLMHLGILLCAGGALLMHLGILLRALGVVLVVLRALHGDLGLLLVFPGLGQGILDLIDELRDERLGFVGGLLGEDDGLLVGVFGLGGGGRSLASGARG